MHTKFRDEIRPRFSVMRARVPDEGRLFLPRRLRKSAEEYENMARPTRACSRALGLSFRAVAADTTRDRRHRLAQFHVLADSGEDAIAFCPASDYAANVELAEALSRPPAGVRRRHQGEGLHPGQDHLRAGRRVPQAAAGAERER